MIRLSAATVTAARSGDRAALEQIVTTAHPVIYGLALRSLAHPADAEDTTQEVLIKVITNLGSLQDPEAAGAWIYRIACRHLVHSARQGRIEAMRLSFRAFAEDLETGTDVSPPNDLTNSERDTALSEIRLSCTLAMLTCLKRPLRMAYILGEILEFTDQEAAVAMGLKPGTYRQRLKRARSAVDAFMHPTCGMVSETAFCHCNNRLGAALKTGRVQRCGTRPDEGLATLPTPNALAWQVHQLEQARRAAAAIRAIPASKADPKSYLKQILSVLD